MAPISFKAMEEKALEGRTPTRVRFEDRAVLLAHPLTRMKRVLPARPLTRMKQVQPFSMLRSPSRLCCESSESRVKASGLGGEEHGYGQTSGVT